jgi:hypothetical protein
MNFWIHNFFKTKHKEVIKVICIEYNNLYCRPTYPQKEFEWLFEDCWNYVLTEKQRQREGGADDNNRPQ